MPDEAAKSAGALLRDARARAKLSQAALARRARVTQSVISAYETGSREPSLPMLMRLVEATGSSLQITVEPPRAATPLKGPMGRHLQNRRAALLAAAARYGAANLRVFGSVARGEEHGDSDIDVLVDLPPDIGLFGLLRLRQELTDILGASVDLVPASDLKPGVREAVAMDQVPL